MSSALAHLAGFDADGQWGMCGQFDTTDRTPQPAIAQVAAWSATYPALDATADAVADAFPAQAPVSLLGRRCPPAEWR